VYDIIPNGRNIAVTAENKEVYIILYSRWLMVDSVEQQFCEFARGFYMVTDTPALMFFDPHELEMSVIGTPVLDMSALEGSAEYDGGYSAKHEVIKWFWGYLQHMDDDKKKVKLTPSCNRDCAHLTVSFCSRSCTLRRVVSAHRSAASLS
jgi:hypothetical protein